MKKRIATILLIAFSTCILACGLWACTTPSQEKDSQSESANEQVNADNEADRIKMMQGEEKIKAAQEFYAPKVTTEKETGATIQLVPNDPFQWNTAILHGDKRGCEAEGCHNSLIDVPQLLPMTHPKLWNPYNIDATLKFCYMCHSKSLFMEDSIHAIHMNSDEFDGDCNSCHYINPTTGEYQMWDLVKYDTAYMGINDVPKVPGDFSFTQDSITPTDELFYYWENNDHRGITPDNDTSDEAYKNWEIKVSGNVGNEFSFKLPDFEDQMVERVYKMDCQTNPPGGAYIANVKVKGIPLSAVMEKAQVGSDWNAMHSVADDGWDVYPLGKKYIDEHKDDILLVTEINGEKLQMLHGFPVQMWTPTLGGCQYTKRVVELNFAQDEKDPAYFKGFTNPKTGTMFNKPNTAIFNYANGTIFSAGQPIEFEGFADAYDVPVTAVEISLDRGKTWTTYDLGETDPMRWVNWKLTFTPEKPGAYLIKVRAKAADGSVSTDPSQLFFNVQ